MKHHHCQSIKNENFTCNRLIISPRPMTRCDGTCFQRSIPILILQLVRNNESIFLFIIKEQHQYPSYIYHPIPFKTVQPCSAMPLICNPSFNYPFHEPSDFKTIKTTQKTLDPSSYRVTIRRITPSHVAAATAEAYRAHRNKDSDRIHLEPFNQIITSPHQNFRTTQTTDIYGRNYLNSDNQNVPSVPSKKIVSKNNGIQVSSTSFITTTDDQKSFISDNVLEKSSEHHMIPAQTLNELSFSITEVEKSNNDSFVLSKFNSELPTINVITPMTINRSDNIMTNKNVDNISNKSQITKQIESKRNSIVKEHSFIKPQSTTDKTERYEEHSINEKFRPLEFSHHHVLNESNVNTPESTINPSVIGNSHPPTLPQSLPPNIANIKSNEMLINSSRSIKSITFLINGKQKSSTDIRQSSLPLHTARSTLDFGLLIHETTTQNF